jgi:hypothetical protein
MINQREKIGKRMEEWIEGARWDRRSRARAPFYRIGKRRSEAAKVSGDWRRKASSIWANHDRSVSFLCWPKLSFNRGRRSTSLFKTFSSSQRANSPFLVARIISPLSAWLVNRGNSNLTFLSWMRRIHNRLIVLTRVGNIGAKTTKAIPRFWPQKNWSAILSCYKFWWTETA